MLSEAEDKLVQGITAVGEPGCPVPDTREILNSLKFVVQITVAQVYHLSAKVHLHRSEDLDNLYANRWCMQRQLAFVASVHKLGICAALHFS